MERLRAKLKSESGASITYALLLFLVCAVLSSVILIAATVSSGRISGLVESDQRYYSVTSAVEAIRDMVDGKEVTIVTVSQNGEADKTYLIDKPADQVTYKDIAIEYDPDNSGMSSSGLVLDNYFTPGSLTEFFANEYYKTLANPVTADLQFTIGAQGTTSLNVKAEGRLDDTGNITLIVYNDESADIGNPYQVTMEFMLNAESKSSDGLSSSGLSEQIVNGPSVQSGVTISKRSLCWNLQRITNTAVD